jgi:hypothetical protein
MTTQPTKRDRSNRARWWTLKRRRWAYGVLMAAAPVAAAFGIGTAQQHAAIGGLAAAVLGVGALALANPTKE